MQKDRLIEQQIKNLTDRLMKMKKRFVDRYCKTPRFSNVENKEIEGKIYFNPGSPTDKMFTPHLSYGILEINGKNLKRKVVKIG